MAGPAPPALPPYLVVVRLFVPPELRERYRAAVARIAASAGSDLLRTELWEDAARPGFFLESYLFQDLSAWSLAREGTGPTASAFGERRALIPEDCEEVLGYEAVISARDV
ncbi:MAG: hypothetical protein U0166_24240 [Acidobacteriota bacterium]